jgi:hypothetical protein
MLCSVYSAQPNGLSCPLLKLMGLEIIPSPSSVRVRGSENPRRRRHDVRAHLRPVHAAGDRQGGEDGAPGGAPARAGGVPTPRERLVPRAHGGAAPQRPRVAAPDGAAAGHQELGRGGHAVGGAPSPRGE